MSKYIRMNTSTRGVQ